MKDFFKNPWVIGALIVVALIAVYYLLINEDTKIYDAGGDVGDVPAPPVAPPAPPAPQPRIVIPSLKVQPTSQPCDIILRTINLIKGKVRSAKNIETIKYLEKIYNKSCAIIKTPVVYIQNSCAEDYKDLVDLEKFIKEYGAQMNNVELSYWVNQHNIMGNNFKNKCYRPKMGGQTVAN